MERLQSGAGHEQHARPGAVGWLVARVGRARNMPADQSTARSTRRYRVPTRILRSARRRRPTGEPPPLPYQLQSSGIGWLVAAVVLVGLALVVFARGLRGPAVAVTVVDDTVVG